jgi:hypothetical protein
MTMALSHMQTRGTGEDVSNEVKGEARPPTVTYRCKVLLLCTGRWARQDVFIFLFLPHLARFRQKIRLFN